MSLAPTKAEPGVSRSNDQSAPPSTVAGSVLTEAGRHPLAAFAHSLPLACGVATAILALAVGSGADHTSRRAIQGLEPDVVVVSATAPSSSGVLTALASPTLTRDDAQALGAKGFVPDGLTAVPTAGLHANVVSFLRSWNTDVIGSTKDFAVMLGYPVDKGRFLTQTDVMAAAPVVVLGQTVVNRLFAGGNPVGRQMQIDSHPFQVVGVLAGRTGSATFDQNDLAVVPITAAWSNLLQNKPVIDEVLVKSSSGARTRAVKAEVTRTLLQRHQIVNPAAADFEVRTLADVTAGVQQRATAVRHTLALAATLLLGCAAIHLRTLVQHRPGRWSTDSTMATPAPTDGSALVADIPARAAIATVLGIALAAASAGVVRHLIGGIPRLDVTPASIAWGAIIGWAVGGAIWLLNLGVAPGGRSGMAAR